MDAESEPVQVQEAESTTSSIQENQTKSPILTKQQELGENDQSDTSESTSDQKSTSTKPKIAITLKTPKEKQVVEVDEDAAIKDIKVIAADKFAADPDYLCLIFAGKLMEDDDTLETHNITDGMTIHLIIKTAPRQPEPGPQRPPADISQTPFNLGAIGGLVGLESLGLGSANFMELQNRLQTELLGNPELLRRVLENPLVQSLMNDTENMKSLIQNNPQMRDLMSRHPEIKSMLNNTELLRQTAELAKNPSMLQELMRNLDGSNPMDGSTTTFTTLPNIYNAFQEPQISSATAKVQEAQKPTEPGFIFNNPQMSSLLQQMFENPQMIHNMMSAPYTQAMLQALQADPTMASAIINENPLYKNNPVLQQYLSSIMPQLVTQLQNPEVLKMMSNPQAINALLQIQEGLDGLKNVAPGFVANLGVGPFYDFNVATTTSTPTPSSSSNPTEPSSSAESFSRFMAQMVSQMSQFNPTLPPEQRYKFQLEHLKSMGFTNEDVNIQALTAAFGDVNAAIQRLLAQNNKLV